jgi:cytoskeleton protein RodZ
MNEDISMSDVQPADNAAGAAPGAPEPTAGALLRQAREAAGVHIGALAGAMKVPVHKLQAFEEDDYSVFPDAVFTRALASSICRVLQVDAAPVLARLPQGQRPSLGPAHASINAAFKDPGPRGAVRSSGTPVGGGRAGSRVVGLAVLALLVGAALVYFVPSSVLDRWMAADAPAPQAQTPVVTAAAAVAEPASEPAVAEPVPAQEPAAPASVAPPATPAPAASVPAAAPAPVASAPAAEGIIEFRASAESWVQVRDATGAVTFQRSLQAGETAQAPGKPPLAVVVGKVDVTAVSVRGKPFDLKAVSRDNVARFEVK